MQPKQLSSSRLRWLFYNKVVSGKVQGFQSLVVAGKVGNEWEGNKHLDYVCAI